MPIVADIHFKPEAALEAARWVEMVRVNPGNYADTKKFAVKEYSDAQYAAELARIEEKFTPLVKLCKELGRALRIGANHGSLSDRIMNRFGDTPLGMVESALEFARIARKHDFHNFKFSMKSSNPKVMIECYRLLVARLEQEGPDWNYPIHLGVTEAGRRRGRADQERHRHRLAAVRRPGRHDSRLAHGRFAARNRGLPRLAGADPPTLDRLRTSALASQPCSLQLLPFDPFTYTRRRTPEIELADGVKCGGEQTVRVVVTRAAWDKVAPKLSPKADVKPEAVYEDLNVLEIDPTQRFRGELRHAARDGQGRRAVAGRSPRSVCWRRS